MCVYDTIIIGGGPAGLSAALVLGRCMRSALICDSGRYRNERSQALHCYMGHDGIAPAELLERSRRQLEPYHTIKSARGMVCAVTSEHGIFVVRVESGEKMRSKTLLVASGVVDELPQLEGIEPLFGRSIHVCPYCDGWEHRGAAVAVYGQGENATRYAVLLRQWTDDLVLCTNGDALRDEDAQLLKQRGIGVREAAITGLDGNDGCLHAVRFAGGEILQRSALFFTTGQHPRSRLLENLGCRFEEEGGVSCDEEGRTSVEGVFVAGDVPRDVQLAIIAAAEGARAALAINKELLDRDGRDGL